MPAGELNKLVRAAINCAHPDDAEILRALHRNGQIESAELVNGEIKMIASVKMSSNRGWQGIQGSIG